jgi:hypothetical protein
LQVWPETVARLVEIFLPADYPHKSQHVQSLRKAPAHGADVSMVDADVPAAGSDTDAVTPKTLLPECEVYLLILELIVLIDSKLYAEV